MSWTSAGWPLSPIPPAAGQPAAHTQAVPILASVTFIQADGNRGVTGQTVEAFWNSISHVPLLSIGMNCALGPREMRPLIEELSGLAPIYVSAYPNAGLPDPLSPTGYPGNPGIARAPIGRVGRGGLAEHRRRLLRHHARAYPGDRRSGARSSSRACRPKVQPCLRLSGLEALTIRPDTNFVNIGERTNVTGSPRFSKLILGGQFEEALAVARQQVENGAQIIDVNMDEGMLDGVKAMTHFLNLVGVGAGHLPACP